MKDVTTRLTAADRHSLFEACAREAERLGGDERTTDYFFGRAQSSRVWLAAQGAVTIADMDIADWCSAIAWSAPGRGRSPQKAGFKSAEQTNAQRERQTPADAPEATTQSTTGQTDSTDAPRQQKAAHWYSRQDQPQLARVCWTSIARTLQRLVLEEAARRCTILR